MRILTVRQPAAWAIIHVRLCDACWQARGWLYTIRGWEAIA